MTSASSQEGTILLRFLENSLHPWLNSTLSIDMDIVQAKVVASIPPFTLERALICTAAIALFWLACFLFLHFLVFKPFFAMFRTLDWIEPVYQLNWKKQAYYTSFWHSIVHAAVSGLLGVYCLAYADGKPGTTWLDTPEYQMTMYDIQKYSQLVSIGYLIYDLFFCIICSEESDSMADTYAHHFFAIAGASQACYIGGFLGSTCQLTWITEGSTPFVNLRTILSHHKLDKTTLYVVNGLVMTLVFFVIRVCFYTYTICIKCVEHCIINRDTFWPRYEDHLKPFCYICMFLYVCMYGLNIFWFSKIFKGLLKALGIMKSSKKRVDTDKGKKE